MNVYCSQSLQSVISWINSETTNEITIQLTEYIADRNFATVILRTSGLKFQGVLLRVFHKLKRKVVIDCLSICNPRSFNTSYFSYLEC